MPLVVHIIVHCNCICILKTLLHAVCDWNSFILILQPKYCFFTST